MLDDFYSEICNSKHYGPILRVEGDIAIMRCSICDKVFEAPRAENGTKKRSTKTCIQACEWVKVEDLIKCLSCGYSGPLP